MQESSLQLLSNSDSGWISILFPSKLKLGTKYKSTWSLFDTSCIADPQPVCWGPTPLCQSRKFVSRLIWLIYPLSLKALNEETIRRMFETYPHAKIACIFMAQPLQDGCPAFVLGLVGTDKRFDSDSVQHRWKFMESEALRVGLILLGFSSDGGKQPQLLC